MAVFLYNSAVQTQKRDTMECQLYLPLLQEIKTNCEAEAQETIWEIGEWSLLL